jgi:hypothetical protein
MNEKRLELESREKIIKIYKTKVHGKKPDTTKMTKGHDGKKGHWLEDTMGSKRDASNKPDLFGYEMKTGGSKTTFGDWGPDYFIYRDEKKFPNLIGKTGQEKSKLRNMNKDEVFLKAFGVWRNAGDDPYEYKLDGKIITWYDIGKDGYYSWSGEPSPNKVTDGVNAFGQSIVINENNSISITYCFSKDTRENKSELVPKEFQIENLKLFGWSDEWIKGKVENKFNVYGWFKCNIKKEKFYEIIFGNKITLSEFLKWVRNGDVVFDVRLKERRPDTTDRLGMMWRAPSTFWKSKSVETYP